MDPINKLFLNRKQLLFLLLSALVIIIGCEDDYLTINAFEAEGTTVNYTLPDTSSTLQVAVISLQCSKQKNKNIEKSFEFLDSIMNVNPEVDLISFGEALTGWYAESTPYISEIAETIPGSFTDSLASYAKKHSIYVSMGMAEKKKEQLYNSLVVLNPKGEIIGIHRKNTLTPEDEKAGYMAMKNANIIDFNEFKAGLVLCADVNMGYGLLNSI